MISCVSELDNQTHEYEFQCKPIQLLKHTICVFNETIAEFEWPWELFSAKKNTGQCSYYSGTSLKQC